MMKLNKEFLLSTASGLACGLLIFFIVLVFNSTNSDYISDNDIPATNMNIEQPEYLGEDDKADLLYSLLTSFGYDAESLMSKNDSAEQFDTNTDINEIKVRIVANAIIDSEEHTLIEVDNGIEKKVHSIYVGAVVNGFNIDGISEKEITISKDGHSYRIKLFKPQEISIKQ